MQSINEQVNKKNESSADSKISICGMMNSSISEIIEKIESEMPSLFQGYSDLYTRYLHSIKDMYGVCNLTEKQYFEKLNVNQNILRAFDDCFKSSTQILESNVDLSVGLVRSYIQFRLSFVDLWDKHMHVYMNIYAKTLSEFFQRKDTSK